MNFDPGRVRIALQLADGVVSGVKLSCERPAVARLLHGRDAAQAVALLPLLYSLCGQAQGIAARAALAAARGMGEAERLDTAVRAEAAREHAWKLFVDWPGQLGLNSDEAFFVRLMRAPPEQRVALATALAAHALPSRVQEVAGTGPGADLFCQRVRARITELSDWLADRPGRLGRLSAVCRAPGVGEARVETARGLLVHRLTLDGERVADCLIDAPTDRHFAPQGEAAAGLQPLCGMVRQEAGRQARLLVLAFDPCVPWTCEAA